MNNPSSKSVGFIIHVIIKAALLFALCNLIYVLINPLTLLGNLSLYGSIIPARERFPYSENPPASYSVSISDLNTMFASHSVSQPKADDEFRVLLIGDSATWGWYLEPDETYAAYINDTEVTVNDGRRIVTYNLAYPTLALAKDLLILDQAQQFQPDLIIWLVTLESFPQNKQIPSNPIDQPIVHDNQTVVRSLVDEYPLDLPLENLQTEPRPTLFNQRRELADWLRLQMYGFSWAATGVDQFIPDEIPLRRSDFEADGLLEFNQWNDPTTLTRDDLAFNILQTGIQLADAPIMIVNEPMFISEGENSDQRYNSLYPRWAYDQYRDLLADIAAENDWLYYDWWDTIAPDEFTDSPVHLTPDGSRQMAEMLIDIILETIG